MTSTATVIKVEMDQERRRSSRKRAVVSYQEADLTDDDVLFGNGSEDDEDMDDDDAPPVKRRKVVVSNRPLPKRKIFPFFDLPQELRDIIYDYCLCDPSSNVNLINGTRAFRQVCLRVTDAEMELYRSEHNANAVPQQRIKRYTKPSPYGNHLGPAEKSYEHMNRFAPQLLEVNKRLHEECRARLYSRHTFTFDHPATLFAFAHNIGSQNLTLLRKIRLIGWGGRRQGHGWKHAAMTSIIGAVNLELLELDFNDIRWYWNTWGHADERWERQIRGLAKRFMLVAGDWVERFGMANGRWDAGVDVVDPGRNTAHSKQQHYHYHHPGMAPPTSPDSSKTHEAGCAIFRDELRKTLKRRRY